MYHEPTDRIKSAVKSCLLTAFCLGLLPFGLVDRVFRRFRWLRGA